MNTWEGFKKITEWALTQIKYTALLLIMMAGAYGVLLLLYTVLRLH